MSAQIGNAQIGNLQIGADDPLLIGVASFGGIGIVKCRGFQQSFQGSGFVLTKGFGDFSAKFFGNSLVLCLGKGVFSSGSVPISGTGLVKCSGEGSFVFPFAGIGLTKCSGFGDFGTISVAPRTAKIIGYPILTINQNAPVQRPQCTVNTDLPSLDLDNAVY